MHWCLDIRLDSSACTRTHTLNSSGSRQDTFEDNVESRGVAFGWKGHTSRLARGDLWYHHEDIIYGKIRTDAAKGSVQLSRRMHLRPPVAVGADPALTKVISNPETFGPIPVNYHKVNGAGEASKQCPLAPITFRFFKLTLILRSRPQQCLSFNAALIPITER